VRVKEVRDDFEGVVGINVGVDTDRVAGEKSSIAG
jgi:hypothetical protein